MSVEDQLQDAANKATQASAQANVWAFGPENTTVPTDSGPVPTIAEFTRANQEIIDTQLNGMGYTRVGTFATGATLNNPRQTLLWDIADGGDGQEYGWSGSFPKVVPATSTPASTGGISVGAWMSRFDPELRTQVREALRRSYEEAGYQLVAGSFEAGGAVMTATEVLLYEANGKAYSWGGVLPKTVPSGSTPTSAGGVSPSAWTDRSSDTTVSTQKSIRDFANTDALNVDGSAALQQLLNYCSANGVRGIVDVPVNCNNKTLTVDSNTDISFVGAGKLLNGSLTITGSLGSEVACTSDTARGQAVINVPGATFSVGDLIYIKSCINSMSPDAGDDRLGATPGDVCYLQTKR